MADRIDQPYPTPNPDRLKMDKYNRGPAGSFSLDAQPDARYLAVVVKVSDSFDVRDRGVRNQIITAFNLPPQVESATPAIYLVAGRPGELPTDHHFELVGEMRLRIEADPVPE